MRIGSVVLPAVCLVAALAAGNVGMAAGTFTLQLENDMVANADRHYTHGTRVSWVSEDLRDTQPSARRWVERLYPGHPEASVRVGLALGQNMYTPDNILTERIISNDRPYAGWLYVAPSVHIETVQAVVGAPVDVLDSMELTLGIVGEHSYAEQLQKLVHEIKGVDKPRGWRNQIHDELGLMLSIERKWRSPSASLAGLQVDVVPSAGLRLGNVETDAHGGAVARIGQGLDADYGPPLIPPNLTSPAFFEQPRLLSWHLFAGASGRLVARNIFLDGNTFRDSVTVDKKPLVGDFLVGATAIVGPVRIAGTFVVRTREFDGQSENNRFGALTLSVRF